MPPQKYRIQRLPTGGFEEHPDSYRMMASGDHFIRLACPKRYWDGQKKR